MTVKAQAELEKLAAKNTERLQNLAMQGATINGVDLLYHTFLLEELIGLMEGDLLALRMAFQNRLSELCDQAEEAVRRAKIMAPVVSGNGRPGG